MEGTRFIQRSNERNEINWSRTMDTSYMAIWCNSSWPVQLLEQRLLLRCFLIDSRIRINKFRQGKVLTVRCWPSCWTPSPYPTSLSSSKTRKFGAHSAIVSGSPVIVRKRKSSLVPSGRTVSSLSRSFLYGHEPNCCGWSVRWRQHCNPPQTSKTSNRPMVRTRRTPFLADSLAIANTNGRMNVPVFIRWHQ